MATLVTGGTGFVGANIVKELAGASHQVISLDLNSPDELMRSFLGDRSSQVTFITGDILNRTFLEHTLLEPTLGIDKIVHAAVYTVNRISLETERSREIVDINITGTTNLLELARRLRVQRFVYVSSGAAYGAAGAPDQTFNEDAAPRPDFLYGITKYTSELLTRRYGELHQLSTASVRLSTPYGPMERILSIACVSCIRSKKLRSRMSPVMNVTWEDWSPRKLRISSSGAFRSRQIT